MRNLRSKRVKSVRVHVRVSVGIEDATQAQSPLWPCRIMTLKPAFAPPPALFRSAQLAAKGMLAVAEEHERGAHEGAAGAHSQTELTPSVQCTYCCTSHSHSQDVDPLLPAEPLNRSRGGTQGYDRTLIVRHLHSRPRANGAPVILAENLQHQRPRCSRRHAKRASIHTPRRV